MLLNVLGWYKSNCGFRPSSPPHPSGLSQSTGFGCPASCIDLALVIYFTYGDIHISMLSFQIIPPSPSPTESKSLFFYIYVSFAALHIGSSLPSFWIPCTCTNIQYLCLSFWLTPLCITSLELTQMHSFS